MSTADMKELEAGLELQAQQAVQDDDNKEQALYRGEKESAIVGAQLFFSRIGELNVVDQKFFAKFDLVLEWPPTEEEVQRYIKDPQNFEPSWVPYPQFKNGTITLMELKHIKSNKGYRIIGPKCEQVDVYGNVLKNLRFPYIIEIMYDVEGTFTEFFELHNFPLDCQDLKISIQLVDSVATSVLAPFLNAKAEVVQVSLKYNALPGYEMMPPVCEFYTNQYSEAFSAMNVILKVKRNYWLYFWKIVFFVCLICVASFAVFTMEYEHDLADIYGLLFTLLLTMVAFQYVVSESLPTISYLTLLDQYVLCGFVFIIMQIVATAVLTALELYSWQTAFSYISLGIFAVYQLFFLIYSVFARRYELRTLEFTSNDYRIHNYRIYREMDKNNKVYGVLPQDIDLLHTRK